MAKIKNSCRKGLCTEVIHASGTVLETGAPKQNGGQGILFSPLELVAAGFATFVLTGMKILAPRLGIDLAESTLEVEKEMDAHPYRISQIVVRIRSFCMPNPQTREKLEQAALKCPVNESLHLDIEKEIDFVWGL